MKKTILIFGVILLIAIIIVGVAFYFPNNASDESNNNGSSGVWSGIKIKLELTKNGETKTIENDGNFPFSENPVLLVQMHEVNENDEGAYFIVRTGEKDQTGPPWQDSDRFYITVGESYYYEPADLNIKLIEIDTSARCPEGGMC